MVDILVEAIRAAVRAELTTALAPLVEAVRAATPPRFGTLDEAARITHCHRLTILRQYHSGKIRGRRVGRKVLIDLDSLRPKTSDEIAVLAQESRRR
jgi:excisionase family DNA binding protein